MLIYSNMYKPSFMKNLYLSMNGLEKCFYIVLGADLMSKNNNYNLSFFCSKIYSFYKTARGK